MNTTITRRVRTGAGPALAVLVTLLALFASAPARALEPVGPSDLVQPTAPPEPPGPQGPGDVVQPTAPPEPPEPRVTIDASGVCNPHPGIVYAIDVQSPPGGALAYRAQWREPGGPVTTMDGQAGTISTGEGQFEVRGVLHYKGPGFYPTEFVAVTVDCPDDPVDPPIVVPPTFTG